MTAAWQARQIGLAVHDIATITEGWDCLNMVAVTRAIEILARKTDKPDDVWSAFGRGLSGRTES